MMNKNRFIVYDEPETRRTVIHDTLNVYSDEYISEEMGAYIGPLIVNNTGNNKHEAVIRDNALKGWHDLRLINQYNLLAQEVERRIEDKLWTFEEKYDPENYFINESSASIRAGIIPVEGKDLKEWFEKYHTHFCEELDLKLATCVKEEYSHNNNVKYTLGYTYKDSPYFVELDVDGIME